MSSANLTRTETRQRSAAIQLTHVDLSVDLGAATDPERSDFPVSVRLQFTATTADTWLDFIGVAVDDLQINDRTADITWDGARIELTGLRTDGALNTVHVEARARYSTSGQGLHRFVDPADNETYLYSHVAPADARRIFPVFEQPDLKASYVITVVAPSRWKVLSNQPVVHADEEGDLTTWSFAPSPPMSTYLVAIMAGPWHQVFDTWSHEVDGQEVEVPLSILCRQSLAEYLDPEDIFTVTRQGLTHYHQRFDYPYPWTKYDQIFVPEYNLGAMENPGCVTFNEKFIFRAVPTRAQFQTRANVILHEMAHMWFGDLVTAKWWDDLWLNESFAEFMGTAVSAEATRFTDAWIPFADQRKAWAYTADQLPSTHPIVADIVDLEAADQNFDGITYAKGAAVLKQLVAWVGEDAFYEGVRRYFRKHAFGNATLADLLTELEAASGRDLTSWANDWLNTSGPSLLQAHWLDEGENRTLRITQSVKEGPLRPHRLAVGLYQLTDDGVVRVEREEVDLDGAHADVVFDQPTADEELVLVNDDDLTYAKVRLDETSTEVGLKHLGKIRSTMARALMWSVLWEATRDAELSAVAYLRAVLEHAEPDAAVLQAQTARVAQALERFLPAQLRPAARADWFAGTRKNAEVAAPGSDQQRIWATAAITAGGTVPEAASWLRDLLRGHQETLAGLVLDQDLRWLVLQSLAGIGQVTEQELDEELATDRTATGALAHLRARTGQPRADIKDETWRQLLAPGQWTNVEVSAAIGGFTHPEPEGLVHQYTDQYFASLTDIWRDFPLELSQRLIRGLFPAADVDLELPEPHPVVADAEGWLSNHVDAPAGLRRIVTDEVDALRRALAAQATSGG